MLPCGTPHVKDMRSDVCNRDAVISRSHQATNTVWAPCRWDTCHLVSQSVSGMLDRPRVVAPSKTCGHVRSSRRRWHWAQCGPRSAAHTFDRVVLAGASTPAWCPVYRLCEHPQSSVVQSGLVSLPVVAARDQKWRVASDKSGLLSFFASLASDWGVRDKMSSRVLYKSTYLYLYIQMLLPWHNSANEINKLHKLVSTTLTQYFTNNTNWAPLGMP